MSDKEIRLTRRNEMVKQLVPEIPSYVSAASALIGAPVYVGLGLTELDPDVAKLISYGVSFSVAAIPGLFSFIKRRQLTALSDEALRQEFLRRNGSQPSPFAASQPNQIQIGMTLIACAECGDQISSRVPACPTCGFPQDLDRPLVPVSALEIADTTQNSVDRILEESRRKMERERLIDDILGQEPHFGVYALSFAAGIGVYFVLSSSGVDGDTAFAIGIFLGVGAAAAVTWRHFSKRHKLRELTDEQLQADVRKAKGLDEPKSL